MPAAQSDREKIKKHICPSCGKKLAHLEGCLQCLECGWSLCET